MTTAIATVAPRRVSPVGRAVVTTLAVVVGAAGVWGILGPRARGAVGSTVAMGATVEVPDGRMRVERLTEYSDQHRHTKGMPMPDAVPDGFRRFYVDVTLQAGGDPLRYDPARFSVSGTRGDAVAPRASTGSFREIRPRAQATVTLTFDVPKKARNLRLEIEGGAAGIRLGGAARPEPAGVSQHDHG